MPSKNLIGLNHDWLRVPGNSEIMHCVITFPIHIYFDSLPWREEEEFNSTDNYLPK